MYAHNCLESEPVEKCMECYSINYERKLKEANIKAAVLSCDKNGKIHGLASYAITTATY